MMRSKLFMSIRIDLYFVMASTGKPIGFKKCFLLIFMIDYWQLEWKKRNIFHAFQILFVFLSNQMYFIIQHSCIVNRIILTLVIT